jgi:hypothetical protein
MSEEIVDLTKYKRKKKEEEERPPEFVMEKVQMLLDKAKEGKLTVAIVHFMYKTEKNEEDPDEEEGGTLMWHKENNAIELLGLTDLIKSVAFQNAMYHPDEGEE